MDLSGVAAVVTGGASGLGEATTRALTARGAAVTIIDMAEDKGAALAAEIGGATTFLKTDVTDSEQVAAAIADASSKGVPFRVAVNCAGVGWAARTVGKTGPHDLDLFTKVITINLIGTFNVLRLAADAMSKNDPLEDNLRGVIINTASIAAYEGQIGQIAYAASKAGVVGLTLPAARDLSTIGIRVNTIAPGLVDTPMLASVSDEFRATLASGIPFPRRLAKPSEYAELAAFLIEHDYINGEVVRMDAALRMAPR